MMLKKSMKPKANKECRYGFASVSVAVFIDEIIYNAGSLVFLILCLANKVFA